MAATTVDHRPRRRDEPAVERRDAGPEEQAEAADDRPAPRERLIILANPLWM
jgi:hypothetical protein